MYAFYDSMKLDTNLQFDFLPINVKKAYNKQSYNDKMASHMEAYFNDQKLRQANKTQCEVRSISDDLSSISTENSKKALGAKKRELRNRTEYFQTYKRKCRQNSGFKAKERESKQSARRNPVFRAKETLYQKESKQSARKDSVFKTKERESKQSARRNPVFRAKETVYQKESKQSARKDPVFKTKERESKQSARKDPVFETKEKRIKAICQKESCF